MIKIYRSIFFFLIIFVSISAFSVPTESLLYFDKFLHFTTFLVLSIFLDLSSSKPLLQNKLYILLLISYALLIEVVQYFLTYRDAEFLDFIFDLVGILVYVMFAPKLEIRHQI